MSTSPHPPVTRPATDKQKKFLLSLVRDRDVESIGESREILVDAIESMTSREASTWIEELLKLDVRAKIKAADISVKAGRYALVDANDHASFYIVDKPEKGKWAGRTFVSRQDGPNLSAVRDRHQVGAVLSQIAANPIEAMLRYGQLIGVCGACGLALTDETSRARGIGPVCAKNNGI